MSKDKTFTWISYDPIINNDPIKELRAVVFGYMSSIANDPKKH